jgi:hypothetical protein
MHTKKGLSSMTTKNEVEQRIYTEVIIGPIKKEECKPSKEIIQEMERTQEEDYKRTTPSRRSITWNQQPTMERTKEEDYRRETPFRRSATLR